MNAGIHLSAVYKTYGQGEAATPALRDVDIDIPAGELAVVLGPSGSGKTTLLNVVGGIEQVDDGTIVVAGVDISRRRPRDLGRFRRGHVGFVFQFFNLIPTLTARENIEVVVDLTGRGARSRVPGLLEAVGLGNHADHFPAQLSGGQQQRVAIARALVTEPDVLLADEPTGALDVAAGRGVLHLLRHSGRDDRTVIVVTHNEAIAALADRVVRMRDGAVVGVTENPHPADVAAIEW